MARRIRAGCLFYCMMALCGSATWPLLHAQSHTGSVPDSVRLEDIRFFKDKEAGLLLAQASQFDQGNARLERLHAAYQHAQLHFDLAAQGIVGSEIANQHFRQGDIAQAFDWVSRATALDSLIEPLSPLRQRMHRTLGGIYFDFNAYNLALPHLKTALAIDENRDPFPTSRRYRHSSIVAICFHHAGQMDSAFHYYHKSIHIAHRLKQSFWEASAYNNYGMALQSVEWVDSALTIFQRAYHLLAPRQPEEQDFALNIRDNLGTALLQLGHPEAALELFQENFAAFPRYPNQRSHFHARMGIIRSLVALDRLRAAKDSLASATEFFNHSRLANSVHLHRTLLETSIAVAAAEHNWQDAAQFQDRLLHYQDSLREDAFSVKMRTLEGILLDKTRHFKDELRLSQQSADQTRSQARFQTLLILCAALLSIMFLVLIVINYRRRGERAKARHQQEVFHRELAELSLVNERLEKAHLSETLEMKQRDITDYALVYLQRQKIFEEILDNLKQIRRSPTPEKSLQELIIDIRSKLEGEGKPNLEAEHIDNVNHAFYSKLKQQFPSLGTNELELCGMIRLGYSAKEIAAIRNIEPASVRIAKTRLKKKMGLGAKEDLAQFLSSQ